MYEYKIKQIVLGFLMATIPCVATMMMVKHMNRFDRSYKVYRYELSQYKHS